MKKLLNNLNVNLKFRYYFSSIANIRSNIENNNKNNNFNKLTNNNNNNAIIYEFNDIPCARKLPFFGTTLDLIAAGSAPQLHKYIDKRHKELGSIFREKLGSTETVFLSSPNLMRSVFLYEGQYPMHPLPDAWLVYNEKHNCKRGLFFMDGSEWLRNRRIMNKFMLNGDCNNWMNLRIDKATRTVIENWKNVIKSSQNNDDRLVEIFGLEEQLYRWSIDVIISLMFGHNLRDVSTELNEIIEEFTINVNKIFHDSSKLMNFPIKFAEFFKLKIWREFENDVNNVLSLGYKIIDLGLEKCNLTSDKSLLEMMLESQMPLEIVKRIFVDLIIAAGDTTAFSSQWILYVLSTNPNIQVKTRENLLNQHDNDHEIPYIRGLIRETLRLYPVAPFIGRYLATDAVFDNYKVNKGTLVILSLYTSGRDENNFSNPLKIIPERWIRNSNEFSTSSNSISSSSSSSKITMPFAIGSRSCIGRKIALLQMQSLIIKVITNFELKCLNERPVDIILRLVAVPDDKIRLQIKQLT